VANWFDKKAGIAMGIAASGVSLGGLLVPIITVLIDTLGWRQTMVITGLGMWITTMPLSLFLRHKPEQYGLLPDGHVGQFSMDNDKSLPKENTGINIRITEILASFTFWSIAIGYLGQVLSISAIATHIMPYFSSVGTERSSSSFIASALPLMTVVGRLGFGWLGDKFQKNHRNDGGTIPEAGIACRGRASLRPGRCRGAPGRDPGPGIGGA